jgi:hypothetical protein
MAQMINPFQILEQQSWQGMTTPYNLGALWQKDPVKAYAFVTKVLSANNIPDRAREMEKYPVMLVDTPDSEFYWDLVGTAYKNIQLIEARQGASVVTTATTAVGIGGARFKLVFDENYFFNGEVIVGELNEFYLIRIIGDPVPEGMFWVYDVQLMGSAFNSGMPGSQLVAGKRFSSENYNPATLIRSDIKGGVRGSSPFAMKQEMSFVRKDYSVAGIELSRKLNIAMPVTGTDPKDGQVKQIATTVPYKDWMFEMEFNQGIGNALLFGRSNRDSNGYYHDKDTNGELIKTGAGIREQMQVSNTYVYDTFKLSWLDDALYNMSAGKIAMGQRKFRLVTGEKGAIQFHRAAMDVASGWQSSNANFNMNANLNTMKQVSSPIHQNAFSMGYQIVEWIGPNNTHVTLEVDPSYDDQTRNKIYKNNNPNDGVAESYRYDIFFEGIVDGEKNNIQLVKVKGQEQGLRGYVNGPFGKLWEDARVGNYNAATTKDEYSCHKIMSFGAIVRDPSRTITLLPQEISHMQ